MRAPDFGEGFETYIFHELVSYVDYRSSESIHHWKSASGFEVDFILGGDYLEMLWADTFS